MNLIEVLQGYLTPEVISRASSFVGENEGATTKAIGTIIPSLLGGLLNKASDENGATALAGLLKEGNHDGGILNNVLGLFNGGEATDVVLKNGASSLLSIFGTQDKVGSLVNLVTQNSNVQAGGATKLLGMLTPIVLGVLGKTQKAQGLDAKGLASLLFSQKDNISAAAPSGLSNLLGIGSLGALGGTLTNWLGNTTGNVANVAASVTNTVGTGAKKVADEAVSGGSSLLKWLLPLLLALIAAFFIFRSCNKGNAGVGDEGMEGDTATVEEVSTTDVVTNTVAGVFDSVSGNFVYDNGNNITIDLPNNGGKLTVGENSTEAKLITFLNDANAVIDTVKGNWFDFTNVRFKTGSSEITPESMEQLKNLVTISKAYPTAQFKVGGYTDNTGDAAKNVALSQKRADAVAAQVVKLGAKSTAIVGAKGYGPEHPLADNATAEGRAMNRRVSVNVKAK